MPCIGIHCQFIYAVSVVWGGRQHCPVGSRSGPSAMEGPSLGYHAGDFGWRFVRLGEVVPLKFHRGVEDRCLVIGEALCGEGSRTGVLWEARGLPG